MNQKIEFNIKNIFIVGFSIITISVIGSYLSTSYALTENGYAVDSSNVEYKDNSSLGVTNVQAAIDGTCTKFNEQLNKLRESMYPVGSIYLSTSLSTTTAVATALGGTWEVYGSGRTLIGSDGSSYKAGATGGATSVSTTLTTSNLPSHSHTISHTHTTSSTTTTTLSLTANEAGSHAHSTNLKRANLLPNSGGDTFFAVHFTNVYPEGATSSSGTVVLSGGAHTHSVSGSVTIPSLSTSSQSTTTSGTTGSGTSFSTSTMQPYIVVYMYRRVS